MEQKTKIKAEDGKQEIMITREFDLPAALVFKAYTEADLMEEWMATKVIKLESKNHGCFQIETSYNGNLLFKANGAIHQVVPDQKIIRTFEIEGMKVGAQLEFLDFEKLTDDTSRLTIQIIYRSEKHRAEQLKLPFANGINMAHDRLQKLFIH